MFILMEERRLCPFGNEDLSIGLIKEILKQSRISREMYEELRKKV
jgi:hypothetical protein